MKEVKKLYFTIGEVARLFSVKTSQIRFWANEFQIIQPKKNKKGNRLFTQRDVDNFHIIYNLVKEKGYTIEGAKNRLKFNVKSAEKNTEIIRSLQKVKGFLLDIKKEL